MTYFGCHFEKLKEKIVISKFGNRKKKNRKKGLSK